MQQAGAPPASEEGPREVPGDTSEAGGGHSPGDGGSEHKALKASAELTWDGRDASQLPQPPMLGTQASKPGFWHDAALTASPCHPPLVLSPYTD